MKNNQFRFIGTFLLISFLLLSATAIFSKENSEIEQNEHKHSFIINLKNKKDSILEFAQKHVGKVLIGSTLTIAGLTLYLIYSKNEQSKLNADNASQKQKITTLDTLIETNKTEAQKLQSEIASLKKEVDNAKDETKTGLETQKLVFEAELAQLESQKSALEDKLDESLKLNQQELETYERMLERSKNEYNKTFEEQGNVFKVIINDKMAKITALEEAQQALMSQKSDLEEQVNKTSIKQTAVLNGIKSVGQDLANIKDMQVKTRQDVAHEIEAFSNEFESNKALVNQKVNLLVQKHTKEKLDNAVLRNHTNQLEQQLDVETTKQQKYKEAFKNEAKRALRADLRVDNGTLEIEISKLKKRLQQPGLDNITEELIKTELGVYTEMKQTHSRPATPSPDKTTSRPLTPSSGNKNSTSSLKPNTNKPRSTTPSPSKK